MTMSVSQLMKTHVVALEPSEHLNTGLQRMVDFGIRHLPIVDRSGQLVGIVSQRELVRAFDVMRTAEGGRQLLTLGDVMQRNPVTVRPVIAAYEAAALMLEHRIGMLPVVDESAHLVGIVTDTDFLEVAHQALRGVDPTRRASA
jgi:CBS domain-containing protein